jgi:hypothetical protein
LVALSSFLSVHADKKVVGVFVRFSFSLKPAYRHLC